VAAKGKHHQQSASAIFLNTKIQSIWTKKKKQVKKKPGIKRARTRIRRLRLCVKKPRGQGGGQQRGFEKKPKKRGPGA